MRQTGIRLDRAGKFWHEGMEVTHPGLRAALFRWLDRREDGHAILRLDDRRYAYVDVEDSDLLVTSVRWQGDRAFLTLNDGDTEELDYSTVEVGANDALYCRVRGGRLSARFTTAAQLQLAEQIEPAEGDAFRLMADGRSFTIHPRAEQ